MYLAAALRTNRSLRVLDLTGNQLTARGCATLARGLIRNRTLTDLDLGLNRIGDRGCCSLADVLSTPGRNTLRPTYINVNNILQSSREIFM